MCIFTYYGKNPRYKTNKKNKGNVPPCKDKRKLFVPFKCGKCSECRKQKQREWIIRLSEELRKNEKRYFVTLTFSENHINDFKGDENEKATQAIRMFLERCRKKTAKSVKHWFITELGEEKGRIHIHGIWWGDIDLLQKWQYGNVYIGKWVNEATIFYITKYMLKENENNRKFIGKVLCSPGLGKNYINRLDAKRNTFNGKYTDETYRLRNGQKIALPEYYRKKIYTDEERDQLWTYKLDKGERYICGEKISTKVEDRDKYINIMTYYQERDRKLYRTETKFDKEKHMEKLLFLNDPVNKSE